ncbi:hypothetical protein JCM11251_000804 [Rhodosporidiobolus azoricus]
MSLIHPRPLRPCASSSPPTTTTASASRPPFASTSDRPAVAPEKRSYPPQPYPAAPGQLEKENCPSSPSATSSSSNLDPLRPPHSPLAARRALSAPYPHLNYIRPGSIPPEQAAVEEGAEEGGKGSARGGAWDREAVDELREIFSAPAAEHGSGHGGGAHAAGTITSTTILLPPRPPSSANGAGGHHHHSSPSSGGGPPRTPSRATGRSSSSRNGNGHARRRSSASAGSASSATGHASTGTGAGTGTSSDLGPLVSGMGVLRVKTPVRVVGWNGEYYSPPSRALTRNPFASLTHTQSHTPAVSFPSALGGFSKQRRLHTHSAYPVMMEHAQESGAEGERGDEGAVKGVASA